MVHIFTHTDLDGYAAGYVVLQALNKEKCEVTHLNYDKEPVLENIKNGDTVVITDYSLSNDQYRQILNLVGDEGKLIWCDHHITAINRYLDDEDLIIDGIRSTKYCGAVLAWCYFNDIDTDEINNQLSYEELIEKIPLWLRLVDAWDTWKLDSPYRTNAEYLNLGVQNNLSMELMEKIAKRTYDFYLLKEINRGKIYAQYRNEWSKSLREKYMFTRTLGGALFGVNRDVNVAVLNVGCGNSQFFGDEINNYDVCITMCFNGKQWVVSYYSSKPDIDCSLCASHFGGGGHKSAAGCTFEQLLPPVFLLDEDTDMNGVIKEIWTYDEAKKIIKENKLKGED